jgi:hypothetical protein
MSNKTVNAYAGLYESPNDLDLWSAGISETPLTGRTTFVEVFQLYTIFVAA